MIAHSTSKHSDFMANTVFLVSSLITSVKLKITTNSCTSQVIPRFHTYPHGTMSLHLHIISPTPSCSPNSIIKHPTQCNTMCAKFSPKLELSHALFESYDYQRTWEVRERRGQGEIRGCGEDEFVGGGGFQTLMMAWVWSTMVCFGTWWVRIFDNGVGRPTRRFSVARWVGR